MSRKILRFLVGFVCCLPATIFAQDINSKNYKSAASCVEKTINGQIFSTFGEGPCPAGSRRARDVNSQQLEAAQGAVNALGSAQQALLNWGTARFAQKHLESIEILSNYFYLDPGARQMAPYTVVRVDVPFGGRAAAGEVGDVLIQSYEGMYSECLSPKSDFTKEVMGWAHEIRSGHFSCRLSNTDEGFTPLYFNYKKIKESKNAPNIFVYPQYLKEKNGNYSLCLRDMGVTFGCWKDLSFTDIVLSNQFVGRIGSESPRLVYLGLKGGMLTFRGYKNSEKAVGQFEDLSIDPSSTKNLSFDGLEIEVLYYSENDIVISSK